jgi:peptidoglycan/xylan/chitin deacetylase (PgdA/CDA1 family)
LIAKILVGIQSYIGSNKEVFPISYFNAGCEILLGVCNASWNLGIKLPIVILTHDIDTKSGFYWVERVSEIEENYGFRSSWNVVPKRYHINKKVLNRLLENGHEIGLHGLWHNNSEAFLSEEQMTSEFSSLKNFMDELMIKGYKSPSWYRTKTMFKVLPEFFSYDLSCLDNDLICPAGNGGVGFMRPFILDSGLVELPCTLPFEAPLFMGVSPENFVEYWIPKIEFIKASSGMLLVNTHPDPHYLGNNRLLASYENLLKTLADDNWKAKLPGQIVKEIKI